MPRDAALAGWVSGCVEPPAVLRIQAEKYGGGDAPAAMVVFMPAVEDYSVFTTETQIQGGVAFGKIINGRIIWASYWRCC